LGQLSPDSEDAVNQLEPGREAIDNRDPLQLTQVIISSHLTPGRVDDEENFYEAQQFYNRIYMHDNETLDRFCKRFEAAVTSLREAATRANQAAVVPSDAQQAIHFVSSLSPNYSQYAYYIKKKVIQPPPVTVREALEKATEFGVDQGSAPKQSGDRRGVFVAHKTHHSGRGSGSSGGAKPQAKKENSNRGPSGDRPCSVCGSPDHWRKDCPDDSNDGVAKVVAEEKESKKKPIVGGGGIVPKKKSGN
jgi:hypothetical protein